MSQELHVVAVVKAKPGMEQEVETAIRTCVGPSRQDAGCLSYVAHREPDHLGRFVFIETWENLDAIAAHEKTPHFQALVAALEPRIAEPLRIYLLEALD